MISVNLNSSIFVQMIGFIVLLFLLDNILYKPILHNIAKRKKMINDLLKDSKSIYKLIEDKETEYASKLAEAEANAKTSYNKTVKDALNQKNSLLKKETENARELMEKKRKDIGKLIEKELKNTGDIGDEISNLIYRRLVG